MANKFKTERLILSGQLITATGNNLFVNGASVAGQAAGEANTASNLGVGYGIYQQKVDVDLQFNSISGGSGIIIAKSGNNILTHLARQPGEIGISIQNGLNNIPTGSKGYCQLSNNFTLHGWSIISTNSGDVTFDIRVSNYDTYPVFHSIVSGVRPHISGGYKNYSNNLLNWDIEINKGDFVEFCVLNSNIYQCNLTLTGLKYV